MRRQPNVLSQLTPAAIDRAIPGQHLLALQRALFGEGAQKGLPSCSARTDGLIVPEQSPPEQPLRQGLAAHHHRQPGSPTMTNPAQASGARLISSRVGNEPPWTTTAG